MAFLKEGGDKEEGEGSTASWLAIGDRGHSCVHILVGALARLSMLCRAVVFFV